MKTAAQQQLQVETNNYTIQQMQAVNASAEQTAQADKMVESLKAEYQVLSDLLKNTLKDYDKDTINNYMSIVVSQQEKMESSDLKKVILATVGFAVLFCLLLTVFPYREQPAGNGKERKNAKNVKELKRKRAEHNSTEREEDTK